MNEWHYFNIDIINHLNIKDILVLYNLLHL